MGAMPRWRFSATSLRFALTVSMKPPCDDSVVRCVDAGVPCAARAGKWVLAATILGSSLAFIDSTVVNVALPILQTSLHATVVGVQWALRMHGFDEQNPEK